MLSRPDEFGPFIGLPYEPPRGCWTLLCRIYAAHGVRLPEYREVDAVERAELAHAIGERNDWQWIPSGAEQPLDAVLLRIAGAPMHIGCVVTPGHFLHVRAGHTSAIESYRGPRWRARVAGFYRYDP
jgi:cell wall-associated NlpC family hydrolase